MKNHIIKKRDLYWCIAFLILIIVAIFTVKLGDNKNVVDYLGFAGTLIGIILAVAALIYAFYQNYAYQSSTSKLEEAAQKIEKVTEQLEKVNDLENIAQTVDVIDINIKHVYEYLQETMDQFSYDMNDRFNAVGSLYDNLNMSIQEMALSKHQTISDNPDGENKIKESHLMENLILNLPFNYILFIYYLLKLFQLDKYANLTKYSEWSLNNSYSPWSDRWTSDKHSQYINLTMGALLGNLHSFTIRGWIEIDGSLDVITIRMDDNFRQILQTVLGHTDNNDFKDATIKLEQSDLLV
jgi:fumarate reductase subunit C